MNNRKLLVPLLLWSVLFGAGCGDDTTSSPRLDSGLADTAAADTRPGDTSPAKDTAKLDTQPDLPPAVDTAGADGSRDTASTDTPLPPDAPAVDAPRDTGAGDAGADLGDGAVDAVDTTMANVTFRFKNTGTQTVYLRSECVLPLQVVSVADGTEYANGYFCACNCADGNCNAQILCAPCAAPNGVPVEPGQSQDIAWAARRSTMQTKAGTVGSFQCVAHAPIPTGLYKVSIQVYSSTVDSAGKTNGRTVTQAFTLTTANTKVEVPIQ